MKPALSQVCTLSSPFEQDVADFAAGHCETIEIWLGKLDAYLEGHTPEDCRALLAEHGVAAPVASFQGGLLASQGEYRKQHWELFGRRLAICSELQIGTLVLACDVPEPLGQQDLERVQMSLRQAAEQAGSRGVRLALEFQASAAIGNNLQTAATLVAECDHPALGLCFDLFHYYMGPSKLEDLAYLTSDNLFHVQFCDVAGRPRELAADADRILPGDGDFLIEPIVQRLRDIGYAGCVAVELMNPSIWQIPPLQFGEIGITALRKVLGLASME